MIGLIESAIKIEANLEKIRQKKCDSHNRYKASYFCTNVSCVINSTSFLCELCYDNHSKNLPNHREIKAVDDLFSTKRLTQIKQDCKIDEDKIKLLLLDVDQKFGKLRENFSRIIDEECKKVKAHVKDKYSVDNESIMKIIKEHEQMLQKLFTKNEIMNDFQLLINPYLKSFDKISEAFRTRIKIVENRDKNIELFINNFTKVNEKYKNLINYMEQKISNFDELYNNRNFINHLQYKKLEEIKPVTLDEIKPVTLDEVLLQRVKLCKIDKKILRLHTNNIKKIISYDNNTKYITCSPDKTIIIRNSEDNKIIGILADNKEAAWDILLLKNGKLATSQDKIIKIWNLTNFNCEQTLIGHSGWVFSLLELPNSMLLSGSHDSTIGVWDISQSFKSELQFYCQIVNDKQLQAYCMTLISINQLGVSSDKDINIYLFTSFTNRNFNIIKTLKGHSDLIKDIKLMNNSKDLLISCSNDKDCRLWSISQGNCLKIFKGHSGRINSILLLSEKIFASASAEIIFWNIESTEFTRSIKIDQSENRITSLIKNGNNQLVFAGQHDFIGMIKI